MATTTPSTRLLDNYVAGRWTPATGDDALDVTITLTRSAPPDWKGYTRRVDRAMLDEVAYPVSDDPRAYVCGPTPFVESVAESLVALGLDAGRIKTERFGATGS